MKKNDCELIQKRVLGYLLEPYNGEISLIEAGRLFSAYGSTKEIERCLDGLLKSGMAAKEGVGGQAVYIFPGYKDNIMRSVLLASERADKLRVAKSSALNEVDLINQIKTAWLSDWSSSGVSEETQVKIREFVNDYLSTRLVEKLKNLESINAELEHLEERVKFEEKTYREKV